MGHFLKLIFRSNFNRRVTSITVEIHEKVIRRKRDPSQGPSAVTPGSVPTEPLKILTGLCNLQVQLAQEDSLVPAVVCV